MAKPQQQQQQVQWMPTPQAPVGCPPGLEYLTQIDQLLVNQQVELLERKLKTIECRSLLTSPCSTDGVRNKEQISYTKLCWTADLFR